MSDLIEGILKVLLGLFLIIIASGLASCQPQKGNQMPKFSVIVTRDTTESVVVEVEASNAFSAAAKAVAFASDNSNLDWQRDYTPNADQMVYTNGADLIE